MEVLVFTLFAVFVFTFLCYIKTGGDAKACGSIAMTALILMSVSVWLMTYIN